MIVAHIKSRWVGDFIYFLILIISIYAPLLERVYGLQKLPELVNSFLKLGNLYVFIKSIPIFIQ